MQGLPKSNHRQEADIIQSHQSVPSPNNPPINRRAVDEPAFDRRAIPDAASESQWVTPDGHPIRRIDWPDHEKGSKGALLFLPGRGDNYEKYLESLDYWWRSGWQVTALDWRGQGGSGRLGADEVTGHISDYAVWLEDLQAFWSEWSKTVRGPKMLVAHSMGGHIALRAAAENRVDPDGLVLIAPMLGFIGNLPRVLSYNFAKLQCRIGDPRRPAWKWNQNPGEFPAGRINLLTHDEERYADELYWREQRPELVMGPGSWGWIRASIKSMIRIDRKGFLESCEVPTKIVATSQDRLVSFFAIFKAHRRLPNSDLLRFDFEAAHEILREVDPVRERALNSIDNFFAKVTGE